MKMKILLLFLLFLSLNLMAQTKSFYDFSARTTNGEVLDFSTLEGKKVMVVNTASKCSLAGQLEKLQELYEEYGGENFEILAFPSNDFGNREPGSNDEILKRYQNKYNISFQLMEKVHVKGDESHPLYRWLTSSEKNGTLDAGLLWNFQKFLIDSDGRVTESISPLASPTKNRIIEWLQEDL